MKINLKLTAFVAAFTFASSSSFAAVQEPKIQAEQIIASGSLIRTQLTEQLNADQVTAELQKMGIEKSEAQMRLAAMSDSELQQVAQGVQRQAGGEVIVISVGVALLILLVIILLVRPGSSSGSTTVVK